MTYEPRAEDLVAFIGPDIDEIALYHGHPGVVETASTETNPQGDKFLLVTASFVSGPTLEVPAGDLALLPQEDYLDRGKRLCRHVHPLEDRQVFTVGAVGSEWPR